MPPHTLVGMIRPAAVIDAEIRDLFQSGLPVDREVYARLLVEWAAAVRAERLPAAA